MFSNNSSAGTISFVIPLSFNHLFCFSHDSFESDKMAHLSFPSSLIKFSYFPFQLLAQVGSFLFLDDLIKYSMLHLGFLHKIIAFSYHARKLAKLLYLFQCFITCYKYELMIIRYTIICWIKVCWFMTFMTHNRYFVVNICSCYRIHFFVINAGTKSKPTSTTFTVSGLPPASFTIVFKYISLKGVPEYPTVLPSKSFGD